MRTVVAALAAWTCMAAGGSGTAKDAKAPAPPPVKKVRAWFSTAGGQAAGFVLEVADTPATRQRGLMFRTSVEADRGMVFVFPREKVQAFYMRNTLVPLDMVFVAADGRVVGVVENAEPLTEDSRWVPAPSQFVVELKGGTARAKGIAAGSVVTFSPALPKAGE
jgi:uncharacterized membrane protein (UPF0127 family)